MILPFFLVFASIGGFIGGKIRLAKHDRLSISLMVILPLFVAPIESLVGPANGVYQAYTYIDIQAPPSFIWPGVTRVREISVQEDNGRLTNWLQFPRPVKAELNYEGVGASRKAIFTNGLVFHETVTAYEPMRYMRFSIKALPHEIPLTTLDEHLVVGGKYFDVLDGTYRLQILSDGRCCLHLSSEFVLKTTFNFYASWWARQLMLDIQNNILQVEKARAEKKVATAG